MRRMFLAVMLLAGTVGLAGCQKIHQVFDPPSSAAPLPQARIQMREVDEHGSAAATLLKDENGRPLAVLEPRSSPPPISHRSRWTATRRAASRC